MTRYDEVLASLRQAYDRAAAAREAAAGMKSEWKIAERDTFLRRLHAESARTLLEIGAGTGQDSVFFRDNGLVVTATDLSPEMIEMCRAKGLEAYVMDLLHLDFPPASFDAAYALNCLLHVPNADLPAVLEAISRVIRPSGLFFLGVYGGESREGPLETDTHVPPRFFALRTDDELLRYVEPFFEVVDFRVLALERPSWSFQSLTLRRRDRPMVVSSPRRTLSRSAQRPHASPPPVDQESRRSAASGPRQADVPRSPGPG
jgi:SAM-dependent methyltransferase